LTSRLVRYATWLLPALLLASCGDAPRGGGLLLLVARDGPLALDRLDFSIESGGRVLHQTKYRVPEEASLPTTFGIVSNGNPTASVTITVTGWRHDEPLDRRDAIVTQVPTDRIALLKVVLSGRCSSKVALVDGEAVSVCGEENTCDPDSGDCSSALIDAGTLPTYDPAEPLAEGGAAGGGGEAAGGRAAGGQATGGQAAGAAPSSLAGEGGGAGDHGLGGFGGAAGAAPGLVCPAGFDDCDDDPTDCETHTDTDVDDCGECGKRCPVAGGHAYCAAGSCEETVCAAPLADCNLKASDGCEIDTSSADRHCLGCGEACADPTPFCTPAGCASHRDIALVSSDTVASFAWDESLPGEAYRHVFTLAHPLRTPARDGDQGRVLIVGVRGDAASLGQGGVKYAGISMNLAASDQNGKREVFLYYLQEGALPSKAQHYPLELTINAVPAGDVSVQAVELKNVRQIGPLAGVARTPGSSCLSFGLGYSYISAGSLTYAMASAVSQPGLGPALYPTPSAGWSELWPTDREADNVSTISYVTDAGATLNWASEVCDPGTEVAAAVSFARMSDDPIALP
jgi:hypothetical protein